MLETKAKNDVTLTGFLHLPLGGAGSPATTHLQPLPYHLLIFPSRHNGDLKVPMEIPCGSRKYVSFDTSVKWHP